MTRTFHLYIGGESNLESATDYFQKCLRCDYSKELLGKQKFNAIIENVHYSNSDIQQFKNVFFIINDSSLGNLLLMKGYITDINWSSRDRVEISGSQSERLIDNKRTMLSGAKCGDGSAIGELSLGNLVSYIGSALNESTSNWWANTLGKKDSAYTYKSESENKRY